MKSKPNKAVAVDGGVRRLFHTGRSWPAATEPQCSLFMKPLALVILLAISSASASEKLTTPVIELPRPNSGTFSFAPCIPGLRSQATDFK